MVLRSPIVSHMNLLVKFVPLKLTSLLDWIIIKTTAADIFLFTIPAHLYIHGAILDWYI